MSVFCGVRHAEGKLLGASCWVPRRHSACFAWACGLAADKGNKSGFLALEISGKSRVREWREGERNRKEGSHHVGSEPGCGFSHRVFDSSKVWRFKAPGNLGHDLLLVFKFLLGSGPPASASGWLPRCLQTRLAV